MEQNRGFGKNVAPSGLDILLHFPGYGELLGQWLSQKLIFHRVLLGFHYFIPLVVLCILPINKYKKIYHKAHATKEQNWNPCQALSNTFMKACGPSNASNCIWWARAMTTRQSQGKKEMISWLRPFSVCSFLL